MANHAFAASPLGIGTAEPSFNTGGFGGSFLAWVNVEQQRFYRALTTALSAMRADPWKLWTLIGLSFTYGVFHAAGPGHGKAVISSYMIANEVQLRRGVVISFISALAQGATAILVVGAAFLVLRGTSISLTNATNALEMASYALVALFGAWLLYKKLKSLFAAKPVVALEFAHAHAHHDHGHSHSHHDHDHHHTHSHAHDHAHAHAHVHVHAHHHHGPGEVCETCGHAHMPPPETLGAKTFSIREAFSAVFAVGLRPCSGALIVLTFSLLNGLYLGGVLSVLAMSIGTAITVSVLAIMAVSAKGLAVRMAGEGSKAVIIGNAIEILGALLVMLMGIILLLAALQV
ncbi:nickel/cobalt transporter [Rhizobium sp. L1K21]|nr:nickel/cobalt transporter [Rhizobium sp. L1K21]MCO6186881.1 nickel/cobalt transporter [Rhizobium sp. L1K21]